MSMDHDRFMSIALELSREAGARGNRPVGSVIVAGDGRILARGANEVHSKLDPTAHAEMVVIREAARRLNAVDLSGCTLYTTMEPCPMCCWAIVEAKVGALVLGGRHAGIKRTDIGTYSVEALLALTGRTLHLVTGVRAEECEAIRLDWMADRAARGLSPR